MKSVYGIFVTAVFLGFGSGIAQADTLKATVMKAFATNPEVLGAVANRQATEQELNAANGPRYPTVDLHVGGGTEWTRTDAITDGVNLGKRETGLTLRQMLFDGGATSGEVARQSARLQSLDSRVFDVSDSVAQRISDIYLEVLKTTELYNLAKDNFAAHQNYVEKIRDRVDAGVGQRADLDLAEGRKALASSTLTTREAALEDARIRFRRLVGEMPTGLVQPDSISRTVPALVELASEIAISNNASLKVAKAEVVAAREAESASKSRLLPTVSLDAGVTRNDNMDGTRGLHSNNSLMLVMNYNLFRGGADKAKKSELAARLTSAMESENNVRRTIEEEVGRAWVALNAAKSSLDFLKNHASRTAEVKDSYQSQFDVGKRTMLDLMNAENELFQAKSSFISGLYTVTQSEYRLLAAMGGLLPILNIQPSLNPAKAQAEKLTVPEAKQAAETESVRVKTVRKAKTETHAAVEAPQTAGAVLPHTQISSPEILVERLEHAPDGAPERLIERNVKDWAAAWTAKNVQDYLAAYVPDFKLEGLSHDTWKKLRVNRIIKPKIIEVTLSDIKFNMQGDSRATASFTQDYRADGYHNQTEKTLQLVRQLDRWLIAEESVGRAVKN